MPTPQQLNEQFGVSGVVRFEPGHGDLTRAVLTAPTAEAEVYLHGGHVTRYTPRGGQRVLWMSGYSAFDPAKAIRGGVPIIFPWFGARAGDPKSPAHGFARTKEWSVAAARALPDGGAELTLALKDDDKTRATWPYPFELRYTIRVGPSLELALTVRNTGSNAFDYEEALHTYLTVGDVRQAKVTGLENVTYVDKVDGFKPKPQGPNPVTIGGETDRVYTATRAACVLDDPAMNRRITVAKEGSDATVVWNPWADKAKAMSDFGDDEWPGMICIETCNVGDQKVTLAAGAEHTVKAVISAGPR